MTYRVREPIPAEAEETLAAHDELLRHLLFHRGFTDPVAAARFLNPDYDEHCHDPFLMKGMEEAVTKILSLIRANSRIVIYSDYDADGIPGGVLLHDLFKKIGFSNFTNYIPHRHDEGFGLNREAIEQFAADKTELIITVDCGIADAEEIKHAKKLGIDTIVTDHHLPAQDGAPKAFAVLDPKQEGCAYPEKGLCGAGVAYKLAQGILLRGDFGLPKGWEKWLLDLVGLATLSDMVPLTGENRVFARYGLLVLRKSPRPGLGKLLRKAGVDQSRLSEDDVVFSVTPKLNAASRLGSAEAAFRLLSTMDEVEGASAAEELLRLNNERKGIVGSLSREIKKTLEKRPAPIGPVVVAGNPEWRPSLLGLTANALMKEHARPVFLWGRDGDGMLKGSCRSDGSVNVVDLMQAAGKVFVEFGGHAFSGGFTVSAEHVHELEDALSRAYEKVKTSGSAEEVSFVDRLLSPDEVTAANYRSIEKLAPFGQANPKPLFLIRRALVHNVRQFGKEKNHIELLLARSDDSPVKVISFFADAAKTPKAGDVSDFLVHFEKSSFGGRTELRLRLVDIL